MAIATRTMIGAATAIALGSVALLPSRRRMQKAAVAPSVRPTTVAPWREYD
jgi:hypothetical protein